mmetsp:Transcript_100542/g.255844  ORF Transcript_100542/g.255844 Transcript_100542/m.255844 type:complete len:265 (+) Transcript_100542:2-796(+)
MSRRLPPRRSASQTMRTMSVSSASALPQATPLAPRPRGSRRQRWQRRMSGSWRQMRTLHTSLSPPHSLLQVSLPLLVLPGVLEMAAVSTPPAPTPRLVLPLLPASAAAARLRSRALMAPAVATLLVPSQLPRALHLRTSSPSPALSMSPRSELVRSVRRRPQRPRQRPGLKRGQRRQGPQARRRGRVTTRWSAVGYRKCSHTSRREPPHSPRPRRLQVFPRPRQKLRTRTRKCGLSKRSTSLSIVSCPIANRPMVDVACCTLTI